MTGLLSLRELAPASRPPRHPVAAASGERPALDWEGFARALDGLCAGIAGHEASRWALHTEDHVLFLLGLIALLQCGKEIHLPPLIPEGGPAVDGKALPLLSDSVPQAALRLSLGGRAGGKAIRADWPRIDPGSARIVFHTSGSTGAPKLVPKNLVQIENEVAVLAGLWGDAFRGATVFSTVSPLHFYGFLFTAVLPFALGAEIEADRVRFPEALAGLAGRRTVLVTSPAFLKRLGEGPALPAPHPAPERVFSSGGFLPEPAARRSREALGAQVYEIYGSTETGGIAWRVSPGSGAWTLFPGVTATGIDEEGFTVASSYLPPPGSMRIEDRIEIAGGTGGVGGAGDNAIRLLGRTDSVVKIEEKRVALNDVENRLFETGLVEDAVVMAFEDGRQYLAAAVVLNRVGRDRFRDGPKSEINRFFKERLRAFFEPAVIPRRWRYPETIPRNPQGKIDRAAARALFAEKKYAWAEEPVVRERAEEPGRLSLLLVFPAYYVHFQGHFPEMKILPAVVQVDLAMKFAHRSFGLPLRLREIPRFKCVKPIFPDTPVRLELSYEAAKAQLAFTYSDPADGSVYSQGKILQGAAP